MSEILEQGNVFFFYRPRIEEEDPQGKKDVQDMHIVLDPQGGGKMRRLIVGEKQMPDVKDGGRKNWAFVEEVTSSEQKMSKGLKGEEYETKTRGTREQPAERPAGEGVYAISEHEDHTHFVYKLEMPEKPGNVQERLNIEKEAGYVISIKNPEKGSPAMAGLSKDQKADLPKKLQEKFRDRRFADADPQFLEHEGVEVMLIGSRNQATKKELGKELDAKKEDEETSDLLRKLNVPKSEHPREPLTKGQWQ